MKIANYQSLTKRQSIDSVICVRFITEANNL